MPVIAAMDGIVVRMWHGDHPPPHVHAAYQDDEALINIHTGRILAGCLPRKQARRLRRWVLEHQLALMRNWKRAQGFEPLARIGS